MSKCCMAMYCIHSYDGRHCEAEEVKLKECPYLEAIGEIARLSVELSLKE